eukprot:1150255-Pelagomonas_calceolata.AAC.4
MRTSKVSTGHACLGSKNVERSKSPTLGRATDKGATCPPGLMADALPDTPTWWFTHTKKGRKEKEIVYAEERLPISIRKKEARCFKRAVSPLHHKAGKRGASGDLEDHPQKLGCLQNSPTAENLDATMLQSQDVHKMFLRQAPDALVMS